MKINYSISDFIFIGILGLLIASAIVQSVIFGYLVTINNYLGFAGWVTALVLMFTRFRYRRYGVAVLLILGAFQIFSFGIFVVSMSVKVSAFQTPGLDPLIFLILIVYWIVNKKTIGRVLESAYRGTPEEQRLREEKEIAFYTQKFEGCTKEEMEEIISNYKDYPWAAQKAIDKLSIR